MARPTEYPVKKLLGFTEQQWERVREFRFDNRLENDADAVRQLIDAGLEAKSKPKKSKRP